VFLGVLDVQAAIHNRVNLVNSFLSAARINAVTSLAIPEAELRLGFPAVFLSFTRGKNFIVCKEKNVAGLASQGATDLLQRLEVDTNRFAFF
jgi:hypothetical protein